MYNLSSERDKDENSSNSVSEALIEVEVIDIKRGNGKKSSKAIIDGKNQNQLKRHHLQKVLKPGPCLLAVVIASAAFMSVSCNAKHSMDKKANKFWEEISIHFEKLDATIIELSESTQNLPQFR